MKRAEEFGEQTEAALREGLGRDPLPNAFDTALHCMWDYFRTVAPGKIGPNLARKVGEAIAAPVTKLGLDPTDFPHESYDHYVTTVAESLRYLIAEMGDSEGEED